MIGLIGVLRRLFAEPSVPFDEWPQRRTWPTFTPSNTPAAGMLGLYPTFTTSAMVPLSTQPVPLRSGVDGGAIGAAGESELDATSGGQAQHPERAASTGGSNNDAPGPCSTTGLEA